MDVIDLIEANPTSRGDAPVPEIRNPDPETRETRTALGSYGRHTHTKPGTRNPKLGTRNPEPGTRIPKPEIPNPKPRETKNENRNPNRSLLHCFMGHLPRSLALGFRV
jgi:hypothetical protein